MQSGATDYTLTPEQAASVATTFLSALDGDPRTASVERVLAAQDEALLAGFASVGPMPFHPYLDGEVVTSRPLDAMARSQVDLLIGTTRDEMRMFLDPEDRATSTRTACSGERRATSRRSAAPKTAPPRWSPRTTATRTCRPRATSGRRSRPTGRCAVPSTPSSPPTRPRPPGTYAYRFDEPLAGRLAQLGACHAADLPYPFGTVDRGGWAEVLGPDAPALSDAVQAAWVAFARDGDPSCDELGAWPAYDTDRRATMLLAGHSQVVDDPEGDRRRQWADARPHPARVLKDRAGRTAPAPSFRFGRS